LGGSGLVRWLLLLLLAFTPFPTLFVIKLLWFFLLLLATGASFSSSVFTNQNQLFLHLPEDPALVRGDSYHSLGRHLCTLSNINNLKFEKAHIPHASALACEVSNTSSDSVRHSPPCHPQFSTSSSRPKSHSGLHLMVLALLSSS
jgi:hypothetical protein